MAGRSRKRLVKPKTSDSSEAKIHDAIQEAVGKLLAIHGSEIKKVREESEQSIINIAFGIKVDASEAETTIRTGIRFQSSVTDSITARLDDPNQVAFTFVDERTPESAAEQKGKKGKKGKKEDDDAPSDTVESTVPE